MGRSAPHGVDRARPPTHPARLLLLNPHMTTPHAQHLLLPVDDSPATRRAVDRVAQQHPGSTVTLLHVAPIPPKLMEHRGAEDPEQERRLEERVAERRKRHEEQLEEERYDAFFVPIERDLTEAGLIVERKVVAEAHPDPAHAIVAVVRDGSYDRVVIGRHDRGKVGDWLFSSVADEVIDELGTARVTVVD